MLFDIRLMLIQGLKFTPYCRSSQSC